MGTSVVAEGNVAAVRRIVLLAPLALAAAVAFIAFSACSSFDDGRPTKREFVAAAERLCARGNERTTALGSAPLDPPEALADWIAATTRVQRGVLKELEVAAPPRGDDEEVMRWLESVTSTLAANDKVAEALRAADGPGVAAALLQGQERAAVANERASAYGIDGCAAGPPPVTTTTTAPTTSAPVTPDTETG